MVLDDTVRLVILQFSFTNPDAIPPSVKRLDSETHKEHVERRARSSGVMVIEPTEKCSIVEFLCELETEGYKMVDALYKERIDPKDPRGNRIYHMVRFTFAGRKFVEMSDEFRGIYDVIRAELDCICKQAMWRIRAFNNPFYANGEEDFLYRALSINIEARQPLFQSDGQTVKVWQKDKDGRRVGDAPLPLKADYALRIKNGVIRLARN